MLIADGKFLNEYGLAQFFEQGISQSGEIFRDVKSRRTLRFQIENQTYFIKQHFGIGLFETLKNLFSLRLPIFSARNEWDALQKLKEIGISAPEAVAFAWRGINPINRRSFIVMQEIKNHISLEDFTKDWKTNPPDRKTKNRLIQKIADITRSLHQNGINHRDYYICHFWLDLIAFKQSPENIQLTVMDWHRAQIRDKVPTRWLVKDLASLLFSAADLGLTKKDILRFVKIYWQGERDIQLFKRIIKRAQQLYQRDFGVKSQFLSDLTKSTPYKLIKVLKNGDTTTVTLSKYQNQLIVLKRYNILNPLNALKNSLRTTRAKRSWNIAQAFVNNNIPTAKPVFFHEEKCGPFKGISYFAMEVIEGENCKDLFLNNTLPESAKQSLAKKIVNIIKIMHQNGFIHRDLKATNILINNNEPFLIDLDAAHYEPWIWFRKHKQNKDIKRFMKNWKDHPELEQLFHNLIQEF